MLACRNAWSFWVLLLWSVSVVVRSDDLTVGPFMDSAVVTLGEDINRIRPFVNLQCVITPNDVDIVSQWLYEGEIIDGSNASSRFYNKVDIEEGNLFNGDVRGTQILIFALSYEDAGIYTCRARRLVPGSEWCSGTVELQLQVHLEPLQTAVTIHNDSQAVTLECDMAGYIYPDSSLQWSRMGDPIIGGGSPRYEVGFRTGTRLAQNGGEGIGRSRVSSLEIQEPEMEDSGVYTCLIDGADTFAEISLTVLEVKAPSGYAQGLQTSVLSPTEIMVTWNQVLEEERNGIITQYEVMYSQSEFSEIPAVQMITEEAPTMEVTLTGLEEGLEYSISVRAYTVVGEGPFSPLVTNSTLEDVPSGSPEDVLAVSISSTELQVSWNPVPAIERNGIITDYEILLISSRAVITVPFPTADGASSEDATVNNLDKYVEYSVSVRAYTAIGPGPYSPAVNVRTQEGPPDAAPEGLAVVAFNGSALGVTWESPPEQAVNGILRQYIIEYCEVNGNPGTECKMANVFGDTTRAVLTELKNQQTYNVSVAAYTIGPGPSTSALATAEDIVVEVLTSEVQLGPDDPVPTTSLSCSLANIGSYVWQWRVDTAANPLAGDRYQFINEKLADVHLSRLEIRNLRKKDEDVYVCEVKPENWDIVIASERASLHLNYEIEATPSNITARVGSPSVELKCDAYGYIPDTELRWFRNDRTTEIQSGSNGEYTIEERAGDRMAQVGDATPGPSALSVLTIKEPLVTDSGTYYCGTSKDDFASVQLTVKKVEQGSSSSDDDDDDISIIAVAVAVGLVVLFAAAVVVALIVIGFVLRRKKRRRKGKDGHVAANEEFSPAAHEPQNGGPVAKTAEEEDVSVGEPLPDTVPTTDTTQPQLSEAEIAPEKPLVHEFLTDGFVPQDQPPSDIEQTSVALSSDDTGPQLQEKPPMLLLTSPSPLPPNDEDPQVTRERIIDPVAGLMGEDAPLLAEEGLLQQDEDTGRGPLHSSTPIPSTDQAAIEPEGGGTVPNTAGAPLQKEEENGSPPPYEDALSPTWRPETAV